MSGGIASGQIATFDDMVFRRSDPYRPAQWDWGDCDCCNSRDGVAANTGSGHESFCPVHKRWLEWQEAQERKYAKPEEKASGPIRVIRLEE